MNEIVMGVDLSKHNKGVTIANVKSAGYDYAILRGGYTGYGKLRTKNKDLCFEDFYSQAKELNFPIGAYYYSCANTYEGGVEEADFLYKNCLDGKSFEYPIYIDIENPQWQNDDPAGVTDAIIGFCRRLAEKGFYAGVYSSLHRFNSLIETNRLEAYTKWVAAWRTTKPAWKYSGFDMWQNSDNGSIVGVRVDTDICYVDFPKFIKSNGLNGFQTESPNSKATEKQTYPGELPAIKKGTSLKRGSKGEQVKLLQQFLNWYDSSYNLAVDGSFGPKTETAVKLFQQREGLETDGHFGPKSLATAGAVVRLSA